MAGPVDLHFVHPMPSSEAYSTVPVGRCDPEQHIQIVSNWVKLRVDGGTQNESRVFSFLLVHTLLYRYERTGRPGRDARERREIADLARRVTTMVIRHNANGSEIDTVVLLCFNHFS
jgi:hypothetical protein